MKKNLAGKLPVRSRMIRHMVLAMFGLVALTWGGLHFFSGPENDPSEPDRAVIETAPVLENPLVALFLPLTGRFREDGRMIRLGAQMAWDDLQKRGVRGELKLVDAAGDATRVEGLASLAADDPRTLAVIGTLPEAILTRVIPVFEENHLPLLIPDGSHQNYFHHDWVFPLLGSDRKEGAFAARMAARIGAGKSVAVVYLSGDYGKVLMAGFVEAAKQEGLGIEQFEAGEDPTAIADLVSQIEKSGVGLLYPAGPPQWGARLIDALMKTSYSGKIIVPRVYGLLNPRDLFGEWLEDLLIVRDVSVDDELDQRIRVFRERFQKRNLMTPNRLAVLAYDSLMWLGQCLSQGPVSRAALRQRLRRADSPDKAYSGLSGSYYFGADGQLEHSLLVTVFRDGKFIPYRKSATAGEPG